MFISDLQETEYNSYYKHYVALASSELNVLDNLKESLSSSLILLNAISDAKFNYRYAEDKWTVKELLQHVIDTERIFAYRALRFSRKDRVNLPGFDQDDFNKESFANSRGKEELIEDFNATRLASIALFASFNDSMMQTIGTASDSAMSVRATGFIITGHAIHHLNILKERYL